MNAHPSVLIVDDDHFLVDMYSMKFKEKGYTVDSANGGEEALAKLRKGASPNVMLLDIVMPGIDGIELLKRVRSENLCPGTIFIALTNQSQEADVAKAKELGVASYIVKANAVPTEVLSEVERVLADQK